MKRLAILFALAFIATPAAAIDFSAKILDLNGAPFIDDIKCPMEKGARKCEDDAILAAIATRALMASYPDETNLGLDEKVKRFGLALKLKDGGDVKLSVEDIAMLKKLIGKAYSPLIVGRAVELLDPGAK